MEEKVGKKSLKAIYQKFSSAGQKTSDYVTKFVGSWGFVVFFFLFVLGWIGINIYALMGRFDPYPYILLNLALSCLAAIQAPLIMMKQNRESELDRARLELDYLVNQRTEREIKEVQEEFNSQIQARIDEEVAKKLSTASTEEVKIEDALDAAEVVDAEVSNANEAVASQEPSLRDKFASAFSRENIQIS